MSDVVMPRLSDSMEEGTILKWLKADGDEVARCDEPAEIETDKATMTYEADTAGTLSIVAQEGQTLAIGEVIARIGAGGEPPAQEAPAEEAPAEDVPPAEQPPMREEEPAPSAAAPAPGVGGVKVTAPAAAPAQDDQQADRNGGRPKASPVARRIARERNIDLAAVTGTGPGGRIVKADVESAQSGAAPAPAPAAPAEAAAPAAAAPPPAPVVAESGTPKGDVTVEELTRTQQVIARRMAES